MLTLRGFSRFALFDGETEVLIHSKIVRVLLVHLAFHPDRRLLREVVAGQIWPDRPNAQARLSLRQTLYKLKTVLDGLPEVNFDAVVVADAGALMLNSAAITTDVWEFDDAAAAEDCAGLEQAIALYRGRFLHNFKFGHHLGEDWILAERERLHGLAIEAYERLIRARREGGDIDSAIRIAKQYVTLEPVSEKANRSLMRLYWEGGQRSAAVAQYRRLDSLLRKEVGIGPDPKTEELVNTIMTCAPDLHPPTSAAD